VEQTHALGVKAATGELARPVEHARAKSNSIEALLDGSGAWAATLTYYRLTQHKNAVSQAVVLITSSRMCVAVSVPTPRFTTARPKPVVLFFVWQVAE
jgi:hypothetical protein